MKNCHTVKLGEFLNSGEATLQTGPFGTQFKASEYVPAGVPVINVKNIGHGDIRAHDLDFIDERTAERLQAHKLKLNDIVFGRKGSADRHVLIKRESAGWVQGSDCMRLRLSSKRLSPHYLSRFFCTEGHKYWMEAVCAFGATMTTLNQGIVRRIELPLPPLPTQRKIAAVLAAYDDLIEANRRRIALLERMAEELYREWFVRLRFPGHAKTKITKGIPAGWLLVKTQDAFSFTGGGTPSKDVSRYWQDGTVNWFTPSDITAAEGIFLNDSDDKCTDEGFAESSAKMFPAYSVMMTSRATIGAVGINLTPACTNQGFITCVPNERYPLPFLYHWIKLGKTHFEMLSVGATFAELTKGTFKRIPVLTPPQPIMDAFAKAEAPLFQQIENLLRQNAHLQRTRDLLLPRLISGKLPVEALAIAFPPSMTESTMPA